MQENSSEHIESPPADNQSALKENHMLISGERAHSEGAMEIPHENDSLLIALQGADGGPLGVSGNREEQKLSNNEEVNVPVSKSMQPRPVESNASVQDIQGEVDISPMMWVGGSSYVVQSLEAGAKKTGRRKKASVWSKDGGDKWYSLTEDSDATCSGCNQSETGGSVSSESGSASSTVESTVRQQRRQRKCLITQIGLSGGTEILAQSSKTLKWDYSGTNLTGAAKVPIPDVQFNADRGADGRVGCPDLSIGTASTDSEMLQSIYNSIKELQTETRVESRQAWIATKHLQGTVRKVVKSCIEIEEKLNTVEERTMVVEADVEALREQSVAHDGQLTDIMWKL
ncbi:hypothetical protein NDU88_004670 [Pleurodeles waltl]|uniref:Uncharacterized protein n=1 Tax=Pleurodeles waltl TaxID=8319 RepID=A0AAV7VJL4_PLEWA|nr:hypothetical protein NDU88_004670 [Pleurodeles waltl]